MALITGAARGLGAAVVRQLAAEGARVLAADVLSAEGKELAGGIGPAVVYRDLDVRDEVAWAAAVDEATSRFGSLDILVNNAGITGVASLLKTTTDQFRSMIEVNQLGVFLGMRTVTPAMITAGGGSIVNVSSIAGEAGIPYQIAYTASKHAVAGMTKAAALELARHSIRVNCVLPGGIDTPMANDVAPPGSPAAATRDQHIPLRRLGSPDEVARLICFLASEEASYCTGGCHPVDGGLLAGC